MDTGRLLPSLPYAVDSEIGTGLENANVSELLPYRCVTRCLECKHAAISLLHPTEFRLWKFFQVKILAGCSDYNDF